MFVNFNSVCFIAKLNFNHSYNDLSQVIKFYYNKNSEKLQFRAYGMFSVNSYSLIQNQEVDSEEELFDSNENIEEGNLDDHKTSDVQTVWTVMNLIQGDILYFNNLL